MPALGGFDHRTRMTQMIRISTDFIFNVLRRDGVYNFVTHVFTQPELNSYTYLTQTI